MGTRILIVYFLCIQAVMGKMFVRKVHTIDTDRTFRYDDRWIYISSSEKESLNELINILSRSQTGKKVLELAKKKAKTYGLTIEEVIHPGEGSLTDTTLIRRFSPGKPHEISYESRSRVYINRDLTVKNAILDMAHELVHFSLRDTFNPYKNDFGLKDFVVSTVEGKGGEVEAYLVECQVHTELFPEHLSNCSKVKNEQTGKMDKSLGVARFYQMGRYYNIFENTLKKHNLSTQDFSHSGQERADFISSAYGMPYPLAAIHEYESIMQRVCRNDQKRLAIMKDNMNRAPATEEGQLYQSKILGHRRKCNAFLSQNQI
jgi:hypothetical protein